MSSWSCPHDSDGVCQLVRGARCDPGMRGCILHGRYRFLQDEIKGERKPVKADKPEPARKALIDAVLLKLPGVSTKKLSGLDAYFVGDRMFACISGDGVGLRLPVATANELQFSRANVAAFQPGGMASSREWIQINRAEAADYEEDLELFRASIEFVKTAGAR